MDGRHANHGGVPWTDRASRSRRASRPPRPCRRRITTRSRPVCEPSTSDADAGSASRHRWPRAAAPRLDDGDQPDRDPRAGGRRPRPRRRQPDRRVRSSASAAWIASSTSARAAAIPGCRSRRRCRRLGPCCSSRSARRPASCPRSRRRSAWTATVEAAPVRAEALAADRRHRGRWPAVTVRAVASLGDLVELAFPLLAPGGVLVAWKRGDLGAEWTGRGTGDRSPSAAARSTCVPVDVAGLEGHCLVVATARGDGPRPRTRAIRASARRRPW